MKPWIMRPRTAHLLSEVRSVMDEIPMKCIPLSIGRSEGDLRPVQRTGRNWYLRNKGTGSF